MIPLFPSATTMTSDREKDGRPNSDTASADKAFLIHLSLERVVQDFMQDARDVIKNRWIQ